MGALVTVTETGIRVDGLVLDDADVRAYFASVPEDERAERLERVVRVGVLCLERAQESQDVEFVRRNVEALIARVETAVSALPTKVEEGMLTKLGTKDGQALAPVRQAAETVRDAISVKLEQVRSLLENQIDPSRKTSTLGQALSRLGELLDPNQVGSVQQRIEQAVQSVTSEGGQLARSVKAAVDEAVKPLRERVDDLAKEVRARAAEEAALSKTPVHGQAYERELLETIRKEWDPKVTGVSVEHVGGDNRPGDILLEVCDAPKVGARMKIVVEAKSDSEGRGQRRLAEEIGRAMEAREADAGLMISERPEGLSASEVGDWTEGQSARGMWVATTHELRNMAIRYLLLMSRARSLLEERGGMDAEKVLGQMKRAKTAIRNAQAVNRKLGEIERASREAQELVRAMRDEVEEALKEAESALAAVPDQAA